MLTVTCGITCRELFEQSKLKSFLVSLLVKKTYNVVRTSFKAPFTCSSIPPYLHIIFQYPLIESFFICITGFCMLFHVQHIQTNIIKDMLLIVCLPACLPAPWRLCNLLSCEYVYTGLCWHKYIYLCQQKPDSLTRTHQHSRTICCHSSVMSIISPWPVIASRSKSFLS